MKNWTKYGPNEWIRHYPTTKRITIRKINNSKKLNNYIVEIFRSFSMNGEPSEYKSFKTKVQSLKYVKKYMEADE